MPYEDKNVAPPPQKIGGAAYIAAILNRSAPDIRKIPAFSCRRHCSGYSRIEYFQGIPVVEFMDMMHFDAMTLGNHEFDWGPETLKKMLGKAEFSVICANIINKSTGKPLEFTEPWHIYENRRS